jgi:hypothetical protein
MFARFRWLLLTALVLLVVWYLTGGREEIAWYRAVRHAAAQGWDISGADRWPHYGILYYASIFGIFLLIVVAAVRAVGILTKKVLSLKSQ